MSRPPAPEPAPPDDADDAETPAGLGRATLFAALVLLGIVLVLVFGGEFANPVRHFLSNLLRRMF